MNISMFLGCQSAQVLTSNVFVQLFLFECKFFCFIIFFCKFTFLLSYSCLNAIHFFLPLYPSRQRVKACPASFLCWCFSFLCSLFVCWLGVTGRCCRRFLVKLLSFFVFESVGVTKSTIGRCFLSFFWLN